MNSSEEKYPVDVYEIYMKALGVGRLSAGEMNAINSLALSEDREKAILANGVLLMRGEPPQRGAALSKLVGCVGAVLKSRDTGEWFAMVSVLELVPAPMLVGDQIIRRFVYSVAREGHVFSKVNAMRVLRIMAQAGDTKSAKILKRSIADCDDLVREAAREALEMLRRPGDDPDIWGASNSSPLK